MDKDNKKDVVEGKKETMPQGKFFYPDTQKVVEAQNKEEADKKFNSLKEKK